MWTFVPVSSSSAPADVKSPERAGGEGSKSLCEPTSASFVGFGHHPELHPCKEITAPSVTLGCFNGSAAPLFGFASIRGLINLKSRVHSTSAGTGHSGRNQSDRYTLQGETPKRPVTSRGQEGGRALESHQSRGSLARLRRDPGHLTPRSSSRSRARRCGRSCVLPRARSVRCDRASAFRR